MIDNLQFRIVTGLFCQVRIRTKHSYSDNKGRYNNLPVCLLIMLLGTLFHPARSMSTMSTTTKTKKCQPAAGDMPDLIQTVHIPSSWLTRQKIEEVSAGNWKQIENSVQTRKTKKCQPPAGDMPDLIQTEHVPNRGLARPKINGKGSKICQKVGNLNDIDKREGNSVHAQK